MKVFVERRMKEYAYADGKAYDMPKKHAEDFVKKGFGYEKEEKKSKKKK